MAQWLMNLTRNHEVAVRSLALLSGLRTRRCGGVGRRHGLNLALLWLWRRPATVALIRPPSLETSICHRCGPKKKKKKLWDGMSVYRCEVCRYIGLLGGRANL